MHNNPSIKLFYIAIAAMGIIVFASNFLVNIPINDNFTWGHFTYPFAFLVTDIANRLLGASKARSVVYVGFVIGVALSFVLGDMRIAIASGTAFLVAQMLDISIFQSLRHYGWWVAPFISSIIGSSVDTALFYSLAFYGTELPWVNWARTDLGVKLVFAGISTGIYRTVVLWFLAQQEQNANR